ncbi:MAG: hypothetical protein ABI325_00535 [Ginsengibacter sp.]
MLSNKDSSGNSFYIGYTHTRQAVDQIQTSDETIKGRNYIIGAHSGDNVSNSNIN